MDGRAGSRSVVVWTRCRAVRFFRFYREGEEQEPALDQPPLDRWARLKKNEFHLLENRHFRRCGKSVRLCTFFEDSL